VIALVVLIVALAVAIAVVLVLRSDDDDSTIPATSTQRSAATTAATTATTQALPTTTTTTQAAAALSDAELEDALITAEHLPSGFEESTWQQYVGPPLCAESGAGDFDALHPPGAIQGRRLQNDTARAYVVEELRAYADASAATAAFDEAAKGFDCDIGVLTDGTELELADAGDITGTIDSDQAEAWIIDGNQVAVLIRTDAVIISFVILPEGGIDPTNLDAELDLAAIGLDRVLAFL
jgi:hypothetical protein